MDVLPDPLAPHIPTISPAFTLKERPVKRGSEPNDIATESRAIDILVF
jgi:hypothetical protein